VAVVRARARVTPGGTTHPRARIPVHRRLRPDQIDRSRRPLDGQEPGLPRRQSIPTTCRTLIRLRSSWMRPSSHRPTPCHHRTCPAAAAPTHPLVEDPRGCAHTRGDPRATPMVGNAPSRTAHRTQNRTPRRHPRSPVHDLRVRFWQRMHALGEEIVRTGAQCDSEPGGDESRPGRPVPQRPPQRLPRLQVPASVAGFVVCAAIMGAAPVWASVRMVRLQISVGHLAGSPFGEPPRLLHSNSLNGLRLRHWRSASHHLLTLTVMMAPFGPAVLAVAVGLARRSCGWVSLVVRRQRALGHQLGAAARRARAPATRR